MEDYEREVNERGGKKGTSIALGDYDPGPRYSPETSEGTINYYLSTNRKGDIMLNRSSYNVWVHAALWRRDGDLGSGHDYDEVTISAWDSNNQYNNGAGVDHEYRLLWASGSTGVHHAYGLRVGDLIQGGLIWAPAWKGVNAVNWAEQQIGDSYTWTCPKDTTEEFCCSSIVWWAWYEQGYDIDATYWNPAWPWNLYNDDNTGYRYNYYP